MNLLEELKKNPFVLAPMAGITDCAFRSFMREMGAGVVVTELVSALGLKYSSERTRELMRFEEIQHPVGIQIFGEDLEALAIAAKEVEQMGADFVDLNFGCPVPKVVKKGAGSATLKDLVFLRNVLRSVKSAVQIPVTIKVRTGWDASTRNTHEVAQIAFDEGITWVAIHGRTRAQGYAGQSDWDYISEVKAQAKLPILGNGDINSAATANRRLEESKCDGVLIGRGCLKNPWIFRESMQIYQAKKANTVENVLGAVEPPVITAGTEVSSPIEFVNRDFAKLFDSLSYYLEKTSEPRVVALQTKKLAAWYSTGYQDSSAFRKNIFSLTDEKLVKQTAIDYFSGLALSVQKDTSSEPFLMGGHG